MLGLVPGPDCDQWHRPRGRLGERESQRELAVGGPVRADDDRPAVRQRRLRTRPPLGVVHDKCRAVRMTGEVYPDRTDQQRTEPSAASTANDHEAGVPGQFHEHPGRLPVPGGGGHVQARAQVADLVGGVDREPMLVDVLLERAVHFQGVNDLQRQAQAHRLVGRPPDRAEAGGRSVDSHDHWLTVGGHDALLMQERVLHVHSAHSKAGRGGRIVPTRSDLRRAAARQGSARERPPRGDLRLWYSPLVRSTVNSRR